MKLLAILFILCISARANASPKLSEIQIPQSYGWTVRYPHLTTHVGLIVNCSKTENFKLSQCYIIIDEFPYDALHHRTINAYNSIILKHTQQLVYEPFMYDGLDKINFVARYYCDYSTIYVAHDVDETTMEPFDNAILVSNQAVLC